MRNYYKDVLFGVAIGDALGVAVEFQHRDQLKKHPVTDMMGYGTHNQPIGTWSDDSSLTFCLAEALSEDYDLRKIARNFYDWLENAKWTPHGWVFDAGIGTTTAISKYPNLTDFTLAGGTHNEDNGNGSLMRILPLVFECLKHDKNIFNKIKDVSSLTHAHPISIVSCIYYLSFAQKIILGYSAQEAFSDTDRILHDVIEINNMGDYLSHFERLRLPYYKFKDISEDQILSTGYVVHSLEASIWCILNTDNYKDAVLKAVNLGEDTDTTAAITGGLAALLYGHETIPESWMDVLVKKHEISELADKLKNRYELENTKG